jgi:hypothetical protein
MKYFLLFSILCFFAGCVDRPKKSRFSDEQIKSLQLESTTVLTIDTDSAENVNLNPFLKKHHFDFGAMIKEVKLLPLETTDESLLSNIRSMLVTDSNIYVVDEFKGGSIAIFNREGKFITRIMPGQAPEEIIGLSDIDYDTSNHELVVYHKIHLSFFTSSGLYLRRVRLPFGAYNFKIIPEGYVFKAIERQGNEHLGVSEKYLLFVTDKDFKLKSVGLPYSYSSKLNYGGRNYLYRNNQTINVTQKFTNMIYQYVDKTNQLKAKYALDFSKKAIPSHYLKKSWSDLKNIVQQNDYFFYIGEYFETETHNVFFLENWHIKLSLIIFRDKLSGNLKGGTEMRYITSEIPAPNFPVASSDKYFISYYLPDGNKDLLAYSSIISNEDKVKIKNLTEDDNPVLVFYTLNNF